MDAAILDALEATWPPVEVARFGGLVVGQGAGGGRRLSSIRQVGDWTEADLDAAFARQAEWGVAPLLRVFDGQDALAYAARARGMNPNEATAILTAPLDMLAAGDVPRMTAFAMWPPLAIQRELWESDGVNAARQAAMARVGVPRVSILGRIKDRPAGAAFCAVSGTVACLHGVVVAPALRGARLGEHMLRCAAIWGQGQGARVMALAVLRDNQPATRLYARLGFQEVGGYVYFHAPRT